MRPNGARTLRNQAPGPLHIDNVAYKHHTLGMLTETLSFSTAPLRRVLRRVTRPGRSLALDVLACGHSVEVLRYSKAYPYRRCACCVLPVVDVDALDVTARATANETTGGVA